MLDRFHSYLQQQGKSRTAARDQVFLTLKRLGPCTKSQLREALTGQLDRATVYRTVDLLLRLQVAHLVRYRLVELSDPFRQHHHHFVCRGCGQEHNFNDEGLELALSALAGHAGWQLDAHQVELTGMCEACRPGETS
jgi:Fur family ferric uptake transcriptional regulator